MTQLCLINQVGFRFILLSASTTRAGKTHELNLFLFVLKSYHPSRVRNYLLCIFFYNLVTLPGLGIICYAFFFYNLVTLRRKFGVSFVGLGIICYAFFFYNLVTPPRRKYGAGFPGLGIIFLGTSIS